MSGTISYVKVQFSFLGWSGGNVLWEAGFSWLLGPEALSLSLVLLGLAGLPWLGPSLSWLGDLVLFSPLKVNMLGPLSPLLLVGKSLSVCL